ncbi:BlaI/MecI/CopY family transcriptional regulator [Butyricicoccus faecihominis]|uniref:BlaI/MecI/CopY family transcriptional regulator n=1 Tax=Butyricicoccus faecihominis TaxID=1712515 RepID=UPI00247AE757|nr:BlaI/MecI/CopY family transcriptional regulator [Butyricicoccus faecihominis]MCQ5129528.1 BlaI/MecI/CopY family transcriptional regulator [Butyricicoccus faecihominis]
MDVKLVDSERKVMDVLWKEGDVTAKHISDVMTQRYGWNINTTYTLIKRCIKKGAVQRQEPNFLCRALIPREEVQRQEADELLHKVFDGSVDQLFASLLSHKTLSAEEIERLKQMVERLGGDSA